MKGSGVDCGNDNPRGKIISQSTPDPLPVTSAGDLANELIDEIRSQADFLVMPPGHFELYAGIYRRAAWIRGTMFDRKLPAGLAMGKPALALEQYEKAAALAPENARLKTMVAASELDTGQGAKGLDKLEQVFATDAGMTVAGPTLVLAHLRTGRGDAAAEVAEKLVNANGESQLYQNLLGLARLAQKNYPAAEEIGGLAAYRFSPKDLRAIERDNALKLLPTLKA